MHYEPGQHVDSQRRSGPDRTQASRRRVDGRHGGGVVRVLLVRDRCHLVFGKLFFTQGGSELDAILAAFVTYAVGFAARPLGGVVFGHFGDKYGRKKLIAVQPAAGGHGDVPDGLSADVSSDRVLGTDVAGGAAFPAGIRRRRRVGRGGAAGSRAQPGPQPRVLGQLAAGGRARRQHARHGGAAGADRDAVGCGVPVVGLAGRVLVVGSGGSGRLLHPHQGQRRADLRRKRNGRPSAIEGRVVRCHRGAEAVSARGHHRDGPALRREHHVLPGGHLLDHVSEGAGPCRHQRHPVVAAGRSRGALRRDPAGRPAVGPLRAAPGVFRRRDRRWQLGLLRVPDDGQRPLPRHHDRASSSVW